MQTMTQHRKSKRPLCEYCGTRPCKVNTGIKRTYVMKYCSTCYRIGAVRHNKEGGARDELQRPAKLRDTGMRIHDDIDTLVHADGTKEKPIPKNIRAPKYWFENVTDCNTHSLIIKVLERAR